MDANPNGSLLLRLQILEPLVFAGKIVLMPQRSLPDKLVTGSTASRRLVFRPTWVPPSQHIAKQFGVLNTDVAKALDTGRTYSFSLVRMPGVEPGSMASEATTLSIVLHSRKSAE